VLLSGVHILFFFSSRRRHTRLVSDWSSDVCSSDLRGKSAADGVTLASADLPLESLSTSVFFDETNHRVLALADRTAFVFAPGFRSEERRVGKECRSRWWREY